MVNSDVDPISAAAMACFAQWRDAVEGGAGATLEELARAHPELADELRRLDAGWTSASRLLNAIEHDSRAWRSALESLGEARGSLDTGTREQVERLAAFRPGQPRYRLEGVIDSGGMGVVLRARDLALGRVLAMKVLRGAPNPAAASTTPQVPGSLLQRFLTEARLLGRLEHPAIVPVHDLGVDERGRVFFTMPWVRGERLLDVLDKVRRKDSDWPLTRAIEVLLKVCDAVAYAHSQGVLHRDLKPENIMLGRFGEVYVMDWGLARVQRGERDEADGSDEVATGPITLAGEVLGTPAYMAPEQAERSGALSVDERADVYSLGAILYHLIAGRRPYEDADDDSRRVLERVRAGPPRELVAGATGAPPELVAIQRRAMARRREERHASVTDLAAELRAFVEGRVVRSYEQGAWAELRKWTRRNRALTAALVTTLVVGIGAGALVVRAERRRDEAASLELASLRLRAEAATLQRLREEVDELWPATPSVAPRIRAWIEEAQRILALEPQHQAELDALRKRALPAAPDDPDEARERGLLEAELERLEASIRGARRELADIEANGRGEGREQGLRWVTSKIGEAERNAARVQALLSERRVWRFDSPRDAERHAALQTLIELPGLFEDGFRGSLSAIRERELRASSLGERSLARHAQAWSEACAEIERHPSYGGLRLRPQLGLVPLGPDPLSGLWEFAHLESGEASARDARGALSLRAECGVVLVLIPGGESDVPRARLEPFFLSKFELTQGQWMRATGANPSYFSVGSDWPVELCPTGTVTELHPVEQITWLDCADTLSRLGLEIPTEAQWEHAYRAGTRSAWYCGDDASCALGAMNVRSSGNGVGDPDGWGIPSPIGAFPANPWGLHDIGGNVYEWARDWFWVQRPEETPRPDGLVELGESGLKAHRGGCFDAPVTTARANWRGEEEPRKIARTLGVRPMRRIDS